GGIGDRGQCVAEQPRSRLDVARAQECERAQEAAGPRELGLTTQARLQVLLQIDAGDVAVHQGREESDDLVTLHALRLLRRTTRHATCAARGAGAPSRLPR